MNEFRRYHPVINFVYFSIVISFAMFFMHPIYLMLSFLSSLLFILLLDGTKSIQWMIKIFPLAFLAVVINLLFNHRGSTILTYFKNGNPLTLESILFGISASFMILSSIFWFHLFHKVVTTDKLLYLFGKTFPKLSLLLSMIFRFIPRMIREIEEIRNGKKALGNQKNGFFYAVKEACEIILTEMSLAFESSIEISMSMKMRGYSEKKRSFFSRYCFTKKDIIFLLCLCPLLIVALLGLKGEGIYYRYYPTFQMNSYGTWQCLHLLIYTILLWMPLIIEIRENIKWKKLRSKI